MMKKGFTLIELLVVVLIIGILSAIALPQYEKAVEKSRLAEGLINVKALENVFEIYFLEKGTITLEETGINPSNWKYFLEFPTACFGTYCQIEIQRKGGKYHLSSLRTTNSTTWSRTCWANSTDMGRYICHSLEANGWTYQDGTDPNQ